MGQYQRLQLLLVIIIIMYLGFTCGQDAIVSEITRHTSPSGQSAFIHHRRQFPQKLQQKGFGRNEDLTINYGILGGQFHFEKLGSIDKSGKFGCYGQPNRETTYYVANGNGYQTLSRGQFEEVAHLFPLSCGGNLILQQRRRKTAKLLADNQRMAKSIQAKLQLEKQQQSGKDNMQPTMVLLVPFCPNDDNEALTFLHQWRQHATPVNVAGYLFSKPSDKPKK